MYKRGKRMLHMVVLKALYGMLIATMVFYKKFKNDLERTGFVFNPPITYVWQII